MRLSLIAVLLLCALALPVRAETLGSIPKPRPGTWSVDTTGKNSSATLDEVNRWGEDVNRQGRGHLAVVVVKTTGGQAPRAFATSLFNRWGIGHAGRDHASGRHPGRSHRPAAHAQTTPPEPDPALGPGCEPLGHWGGGGRVHRGGHGLAPLVAPAPAPLQGRLGARGARWRMEFLASFMGGRSIRMEVELRPASEARGNKGSGKPHHH